MKGYSGAYDGDNDRPQMVKPSAKPPNARYRKPVAPVQQAQGGGTCKSCGGKMKCAKCGY